jgi:hypothetical protein
MILNFFNLTITFSMIILIRKINLFICFWILDSKPFLGLRSVIRAFEWTFCNLLYPGFTIIFEALKSLKSCFLPAKINIYNSFTFLLSNYLSLDSMFFSFFRNNNLFDFPARCNFLISDSYKIWKISVFKMLLI